MNHAAKKHLTVWAATLALALTAIATLNVLADPFGVYGVGLSSLAPHRQTGSSRVRKAQTLAEGGWDVILLGSSRTEVGINPNNPLWGHPRVYNAALGGTNMYEVKRLFDFAVKHNSPKRIVLFADSHLFNDNNKTNHDFDLSRLSTSRSLGDYYMDNLLGWYACTQSVATLRAASTHTLDRNDDLGFRIQPVVPPDRTHREAFRVQLKRDREALEVAPDRLAMLREVIEACRRNNTQFILVIPPVHALSLEAIGRRGGWDNFEEWKREMTRLAHEMSVPLWDFADFSPFASEPPPPAKDPARMRWFWDASHMKEELGNAVVARIHGVSTPGFDADFGVPLTPDNVERHLEKVRQNRQRFIADNPELIQFLDSLLAPAKEGPNP